MADTFTEIQHPNDPVYMIRRQDQINKLLHMTPQQLDRQLRYIMAQPAPRDESGMSRQLLGEMYNSPMMPDITRNVLGTAAGSGLTDGSALIRQDLEPTLYALFVKVFPAWERIAKGPSNGLVHAANQITSPDPAAFGSTVISELGTVTYAASTYVRQTYPITVFGTGRGVSFKEMAAVQAGGAPYDTQKTELSNGMIKLASDVQTMIMQGNVSNSSGQSATTEGGAYNALYFDGFRGVLGSVGAFSSNNAIQVDIGSLNILESIQLAAAKMANNGGMPSIVYMSMNAKQALDTEQQSNQRYNNDYTEIIPGVRVNNINWANGSLPIVPVPGTSIGTYNRTSDNQLVEDIYILDERTVTARWLFSETITTLQIPSGVDGALSNRFIPFLMYGLEMAAPLFCGKVRRLAS